MNAKEKELVDNMSKTEKLIQKVLAKSNYTHLDPVFRKDLVKAIDNHTKNAVNKVIFEIRVEFSKYYYSEGCSCCRNEGLHSKSEHNLGKLLKAPKYPDNSGYDWIKVYKKITETTIS